MTTEIRAFGPIVGGGNEPISFAVDGQSRKAFGSSFYRGESRNFSAVLSDFDLPNFVEEFVLKGWLPPAPCISSATRITTFGSCFAMNVAKHLSARGYDLSQSRAPAIYISKMAEGLVNCHSLLQQFEWALEDVVPPASLWHGYNAEEYGYDADIQRQTRDVFLSTDFFIVTLGLSEIWYDKISGGVLWRAVPLRHFDPERHGFRVCSMEETKAAILRMITLVRKHIPAAKLLFTLSPVPLAATFRPSSCLIANSASKAILRAALDEIIREQAAFLNDSLFYFPAYEIINELFFDRFDPDLRHPRRYIIDTVMRIFDSAYCVGEPSLTAMSDVVRDVRAHNAREMTGDCWSGGSLSLTPRDERLRTLIGDKRDGVIVIGAGVAGYGLYGPSIDLPPGRYLSRIEFRWDQPLAGDATIEVICNKAASVLAERHLASSTIVAEGMTAEVAFEVSSVTRDVEIRLGCSADFRGTIRRMEVCYVGPNPPGDRAPAD